MSTRTAKAAPTMMGINMSSSSNSHSSARTVTEREERVAKEEFETVKENNQFNQSYHYFKI